MDEQPIHLHREYLARRRIHRVADRPGRLPPRYPCHRFLHRRLGHRSHSFGGPPHHLVRQRDTERRGHAVHRVLERSVTPFATDHPRQSGGQHARAQPQVGVEREVALPAGRAPIVDTVERIGAHQPLHLPDPRPLHALQRAPARRARPPLLRAQRGVQPDHPRDHLAQHRTPQRPHPLLHPRQVTPQQHGQRLLQRRREHRSQVLYHGSGQLVSVHRSPPRARSGRLPRPCPPGGYRLCPYSRSPHYFVAHPVHRGVVDNQGGSRYHSRCDPYMHLLLGRCSRTSLPRKPGALGLRG